MSFLKRKGKVMKLIEVANIVAQNTIENSPINIGQIDRKVCCGCNNEGVFQTGATTLTLNQCGYYLINLTAVAIALTADTLSTITLNTNGTSIPSAVSSATLMAIGDVATHSISKIIRVFPNSALTLSFVSSTPITLNNVNISVVKVA